MEKHPIKKDDSYLWVSQDTKKRLTNPSIAKRIRVVRAKLNVYRKDNGIPPFKKPINPHNFRHSRASELGTESGMTEAILCSYFGWEIGSDMPRTYLHLDPNKVRRAVLATYGKAKIEDTKIITHKACQRCKEENPIGLSYCGKCGTELNSNKMISNITQMDNKIKDMKNEIDLLKKNMNLPQIYRVFKQKKPKE
jgi:ribosomal protein L40E